MVMGSVLETLGSPGAPKGYRLEKVAEKLFVGPSWDLPRGPLWSPHRRSNEKKIVPRSTLENTVRKVLCKRSLGTPSNHENYSFAQTEFRFSHFHLELGNNRKLFQMGTLWDPFGWFLGLLGIILGNGRK